MKTEQEYAADPWYKQPWLLLAMIPLVATVIAGTTFLVVSIVSSDGIVKDEYYRMARGYYSDPKKQQQAWDKAISAELKMDIITGDLTVKLSGDFTLLPKRLNADFVSPTHQKYDSQILLKQVAGQPFYIGSLNAPIIGKRYLMLSPADNNWRITASITPPYENFTVILKAEQPK
ncbi:MAG: FixH family protein [Oceanospirillaceae bacterium]|nr:FixH family protein [Oceanospirillaceae bacterium]